MKIKKSTVEKLIRRRNWLLNNVKDHDIIINEIFDENPKMKRPKLKGVKYGEI